MTTTKNVRVACLVVNGIVIGRTKEGFDDGTGSKPRIANGASVRLNGPSSLHAGVGNSAAEGVPPGVTLVDAEWMTSWLDENGANPLVKDGWVKVEGPEEEAEPENPTR